nr:hypothetical protein [Chloroflexus aggregans]
MADLVLGEDGGEVPGWLGTQSVDGHHFLIENMAIEDEEGRKGLVLGGGGGVAVVGEVEEEGLDFSSAHIFGVALVVEENKAAHPVYVGLLGAIGIMLCSQNLASLIQ